MARTTGIHTQSSKFADNNVNSGITTGGYNKTVTGPGRDAETSRRLPRPEPETDLMACAPTKLTVSEIGLWKWGMFYGGGDGCGYGR